MNKIVVGIDPGLKGGIAVYNEKENQIDVYIMPTTKIKNKKNIKNNIDTIGILNILNMYKDSENELCIYVEEVHSIFGTSAKANFSFGYGYGKLHSSIESMDLSYISVQPKKWQSVVWKEKDVIKKEDALILNKKNKLVTKKGRVDTKATTLKCVKRLYPELNLKATKRSKIDHDGIVDAIAIMRYGLLKEKII